MIEKEARALSPESVAYLARRPKSERQKIGQFLTPRGLRDRLVERIPLTAGDRVLDPGVGTGEFLRTCADRVGGLELHGWDIDAQALSVARTLVPEANLEMGSALTREAPGAFDVVIGNPPYFEVRGLDPFLRHKYRAVLSGRPNIFSMFFQVGLDALRPGGYLGYVVPPSMNNGAFFSALRTFILENSSVEYLEVQSDRYMFEGAQTAVQLIVLRKGKGTNQYTADLGALAGSSRPRRLLTENAEAVRSLYVGRTTLWHLGFEAVTGTVAWNRHKQALRRTPGPGVVPLLWTHNISKSGEVILVEDHPKKPQYIEGVPYLLGPGIIVNRITGDVGGGRLRCAFVGPGAPFVGENHINVIRPRRGVQQRVGWSDLLTALQVKGVNDRLRMLTGNTQLSASELTHWLPLDAENLV